MQFSVSSPKNNKELLMKTGGYIFVFLAWGAIIILTVYCLYKILHIGSNKKAE
jgi:hypothetical protein